MTISGAISLADEKRPNSMSTAAKIAFLNEIEGMVFHELIITHEPAGAQSKTAVFYAMIQKLIADELLLQDIHEKSDIVAFIDLIRGKFHEELLKMQAALAEDEFRFMHELENSCESTVQGSGTMTKEEVLDFLEDVQSAIEESAPPVPTAPVYTTDTPGTTELLMPAPYDKFYSYYIMREIDDLNQEMDKYNNDSAMFETRYRQAADWINRTRMPIRTVREIRI